MPGPIKNLVFQGGGVKGSAYAGAVKVLAEEGMLGGVERIAGTSAGAITACMLACGAGSEGLTRSVRDTDFGSFLDTGWGLLDDAARLVSHFGVCKGEHFAELLGEEIKRYAGKRDLTFGELRELNKAEPTKYANLYVVASNISRQRSEVLCADNHPEMKIWQAVRTSMSIPFIFQPVVVNGDYYVDGGLSWNFPIDLFDHDEHHLAQPMAGKPRSLETLGFVLEPQPLAEAGVKDWSSLPGHTENVLAYAGSVMGFLSETANNLHLHPEDLPRTVFIDDLGVKSTDFKAPVDVIERLIASGERATREFLAERTAVVIK